MAGGDYSSAAFSSRSRRFSTLVAILMDSSYSRSIGMATMICEMGSGGVMMAARISMTTREYLRPFLRTPAETRPTYERQYMIPGSSKGTPTPNTHMVTIPKYYVMSNSLMIWSDMTKFAKNWRARGVRTP